MIPGHLCWLQGVLLVMNGLAVINNERFLEPSEPQRGRRTPTTAAATAGPSCRPLTRLPPAVPGAPADNWGFSQLGNNPMGPSPNALKYQIIGTLHAAAYMRGALLGCCWVGWLLLPAGSTAAVAERRLRGEGRAGLHAAVVLLALARRLSALLCCCCCCHAVLCRCIVPKPPPLPARSSCLAVPLIVINTLVVVVKLLFG